MSTLTNPRFCLGTFLLVFALAVSGCSDSAITEIADNSEQWIDQTNSPVTVTTNPEPQVLVDQFQDKAERLMEKMYGLPWSELSEMEAIELPEIDRDSYPQDNSINEDLDEVVSLMKELRSYNGVMDDVMTFHEAIIAGEMPNLLRFKAPDRASKINGSEDKCYAEANFKITELERSTWMEAAQCASFGIAATIYWYSGSWNNYSRIMYNVYDVINV